MGSHTKKEPERDLQGVLYFSSENSDQKLSGAISAARSLLKEGVSFRGLDESEVPWLVAAEPFTVDIHLENRLRRLGEGIFALCDAIQDLYAQGDPTVRTHLDIGVPEDVRGLELFRKIDLFRLDVVVSDGHPMVTELEEIIGNVGKMHAFEQAYDVTATPLFGAFERREISRIWLDDELGSYQSELALVQRRMKDEFSRDVVVEFFSQFRDDGKKGWRFCYVKDFVQYRDDLRAKIVRSGEMLTNPLFQGYGTKNLLALCWHDDLQDKLAHRMGRDVLDVVRSCVPPSYLLPRNPNRDDVEYLQLARKSKVLKVMDAPDHAEYTWGSRGVFFGDTAATRWRQVVEAAASGRIPGRTDVRDVRYIVSELVDSDRFDVEFLHPRGKRLCVMPKARLRLGPIFSREREGSQLLGGHATFVNTSRKAHLGRHAICTPIRMEKLTVNTTATLPT
jgi:hypothetical protein